MSRKRHTKEPIPREPGNPFSTPDGYFDSLHDRVMERIRNTSSTAENLSAGEAAGEIPSAKEPRQRQKIHLRPYLALAASISGVALIVYLLIQVVTGNQPAGSDLYDMAMLEEAGVTLDESLLLEAYGDEDESTFTDWDEAAMVYLSSNEVDLMHLLDENE